MTTSEPPPASEEPMTTLVPMTLERVTQVLTWKPGHTAEGEKTVHILVQLPRCTMWLDLNEDVGMQLANGIREAFDDFEVAKPKPTLVVP